MKLASGEQSLQNQIPIGNLDKFHVDEVMVTEFNLISPTVVIPPSWQASFVRVAMVDD